MMMTVAEKAPSDVALAAFPAPVRQAVAGLLATPGDVAFDADGTLWRGDVGEELLRALAHQRMLPKHQRPGVYEEYERRVEQDPIAGYTWAVEIMEGLAEPALSAECSRLFDARFAGKMFRWVKPLIALLHARGSKCWVVSASPIWAVRPGAAALGIPDERVIGVQSDVEGGVLTRRVHAPIPCGEGKVWRLKERNCRPALGVGNGDLDLPMLAYSASALVVAPHNSADNGLVKAASERKWPIVRG
jgi:phosphatidylglycerophosphatase C